MFHFIDLGTSILITAALAASSASAQKTSGLPGGATGRTACVRAARFDGEFAGRSQAYAGTGTIRYSW
jgi:hypothetical protein